MSKEKKISITHFEKDNVKKIDVGGISMHPLYIRIGYDKKTVSLNSYCFNQFIANEAKVSQKYFNDVIQKEKRVIDRIIKKVEATEGSFSLELFKAYYKKYSINVLVAINDYLLDGIASFAKENKKMRLEELADHSKQHFNVFYLMDLLKEVNIQLYDQINKHTGYAYSFLIRLISTYSFDHKLGVQEENVRIHNKFLNTYIPVIEWLELSGGISAAIEDESRFQSWIDGDEYDFVLEGKIDKDLRKFVELIYSNSLS